MTLEGNIKMLGSVAAFVTGLALLLSVAPGVLAAPTSGVLDSPNVPCTSDEAKHALDALGSLSNLESAVEYLDGQKVRFIIFGEDNSMHPRNALRSLVQESKRFRIVFDYDLSGTFGIVRTNDVITVSFEGAAIIERSCGRVLTGP